MMSDQFSSLSLFVLFCTRAVDTLPDVQFQGRPIHSNTSTATLFAVRLVFLQIRREVCLDLVQLKGSWLHWVLCDIQDLHTQRTTIHSHCWFTSVDSSNKAGPTLVIWLNQTLWNYNVHSRNQNIAMTLLFDWLNIKLNSSLHCHNLIWLSILTTIRWTAVKWCTFSGPERMNRNHFNDQIPAGLVTFPSATVSKC